tara:strand:- start:13312 stop:13494 length:183 start_codon:yes stop_codon:yes gene_type:complete
MEFKKLLKKKGYDPIFKTIDNSKNEFKKLGYSKEEIKNTLIDIFGSKDQNILKKIKENLN